MFGMGQLTAVGGAVILALILFVIALLDWLGATFGEALYVSLLTVVGMGYGVTAWRMRQEKEND